MDFAPLAPPVIELATQVGAFIRQEATQFDRRHIEEKGRNNLVSYVDKQAEQQIVARLSELLPAAGFIAEEGTGQPQPGGLNWVVDPLDGTTNFIHGMPYYSVSIGLMDGNTPLLGVVYEVNAQECFHAVRGQGAWLNGRPLRTSAVPKLAQSLVATGFPYQNDQFERYIDLLKDLLRESHGFRRIGSAAVDLAYVAAGRFEAFYERGLNPWDVAAGVLILQEAGGQVTDFSGQGNFVFGQELVASNGLIHPEMLAIVQRHFPL
jgi:myo-inositol-1(or 4)-monophosphatase